MNLDMLLVPYGVAAIFVLMFIKSVGVPIPIPADVIILAAAAGAASGKLVLWQAFVAILLAIVLGGRNLSRLPGTVYCKPTEHPDNPGQSIVGYIQALG